MCAHVKFWGHVCSLKGMFAFMYNVLYSRRVHVQCFLSLFGGNLAIFSRIQLAWAAINCSPSQRSHCIDVPFSIILWFFTTSRRLGPCNIRFFNPRGLPILWNPLRCFTHAKSFSFWQEIFIFLWFSAYVIPFPYGFLHCKETGLSSCARVAAGFCISPASISFSGHY